MPEMSAEQKGLQMKMEEAAQVLRNNGVQIDGLPADAQREQLMTVARHAMQGMSEIVSFANALIGVMISAERAGYGSSRHMTLPDLARFAGESGAMMRAAR